MAETFDLLVRGGTCVTPNGIGAADVGMRDGRIAAIGDLDRADAAEVVDAKGLHVLPGIIDSQVHFREPGGEAKEDFSTGTAAAALGGVVAVFDMPNTNPLTDNADALADKVRRAAGRAWCDMGFYVGATPENVDELAELERLPGCVGVKIFMGSSTGSLLIADDATLGRVLAQSSRRCSIHSEDEPRLIERKKLVADGAPVSMHSEWRDVETAVNATRRLLKLAHATRRRIHVLHISTAEELPLLAAHRDLATVETTPQHLTLAAPDCYERLGSFAQMNPPIREARHREALWAAVNAGLIDVLGSDHAPHTREDKEKPYPQSPSGMPGVQTLVPVMLTHVAAGRLSLERFVDLACAGPARAFNIAGKGRLALGYDGDLTLVDLKAKRTITHQWIASRCGWTPYDGFEATGWPIMTVLRGNVVMRDGQLQGEPLGRTIRFQETE